MKSRGLIFSIAFLSFSMSGLNAQRSNFCTNNFFYPQVDKKLTYTNYDNKDKIKSIQEQTVKSIKNTDTGFEATVTTSSKDEKGKETMSAKEFLVKCENGELKLDLSNMMMNEMAGKMKDMEIKMSGDSLSYPSTFEIGKSLPDANMLMEVGMNGTTMFTGKFLIKNRKIEAKESITTTAGTFDCYKISYDMDINMMVKRTLKVNQWLSPGIGLIKSVNLDSKGEVSNRRELTAMEK